MARGATHRVCTAAAGGGCCTLRSGEQRPSATPAHSETLARVSPPLPMNVPALIHFHSSVTEDCTGSPQPQVVFVSVAAAVASAIGEVFSVTQQQSDPCADCALDERLTSARGCVACSGRCKVGAAAGRPQPTCLCPCIPLWWPGRPSPSPASCRASPEVQGSLSQMGRSLY